MQKKVDEKGLDFTKLKVERQKKIEVVDCSWQTWSRSQAMTS